MFSLDGLKPWSCASTVPLQVGACVAQLIRQNNNKKDNSQWCCSQTPGEGDGVMVQMVIIKNRSSFIVITVHSISRFGLVFRACSYYNKRTSILDITLSPSPSFCEQLHCGLTLFYFPSLFAAYFEIITIPLQNSQSYFLFLPISI